MLIIQPVQLLSKRGEKSFWLSAAVISGAAIAAEVWSHMLTHVVSEWPGGLENTFGWT